jgi:hypothetical protein
MASSNFSDGQLGVESTTGARDACIDGGGDWQGGRLRACLSRLADDADERTPPIQGHQQAVHHVV